MQLTIKELEEMFSEKEELKKELNFHKAKASLLENNFTSLSELLISEACNDIIRDYKIKTLNKSEIDSIKQTFKDETYINEFTMTCSRDKFKTRYSMISEKRINEFIVKTIKQLISLREEELKEKSND